MSWNNYIDDSYEAMISEVVDEGIPSKDNYFSKDELYNEVAAIAKDVHYVRHEYLAEKWVCSIIFDEFAREDMGEKYFPQFIKAIEDCDPIKEDSIAQECANEINIDAVIQYCLEYEDE